MAEETSSASQSAQHLLDVATRLTRDLDEAGLFLAAAYASMVADAIRSKARREGAGK
jgi:hypothetical protein